MMRIGQILSQFTVVSRAKDWRLSFVPFIMACVYLWLWWFQISVSIQSIMLVLLSCCTTIGFASLGYFINEFFDKHSDKRAGKVNRLAALSTQKQALILSVILLITFLPWLWLPADSMSWLLIFDELL